MKLKNTPHHSQGFTVVELAVTIVVIGILASVSILGYGTWREKLAKKQMESDLSQLAASMKETKTFKNSYPVEIPTSYKPSPDIFSQLAASSSGEYCVNVYHKNFSNLAYSYDSKTSKIRTIWCSGAPVGAVYPSGNSLPEVAFNTNLVADFSEWDVSGGITYDSASRELVFNGTTSGSAKSPLIRVQGSTSSRLTIDSYSTQASPTRTPDGGVYFGSNYYGSDGVTPAMNTSNYSGNGNAQATPLSSWQTRTWNTPTGANVHYIRFNINSAPTSYTSDNRIRNPSIQAIP